MRLDRHRLVLRVEGRRGLTDVPLPLAGPGPARTAEEVLGRLRTLLCCGSHDPRGASALGEQEA